MVVHKCEVLTLSVKRQKWSEWAQQYLARNWLRSASDIDRKEVTGLWRTNNICESVFRTLFDRRKNIRLDTMLRGPLTALLDRSVLKYSRYLTGVCKALKLSDAF